jgi:DNA-binding LytR/AlgR family response regulator
MGIKCVIVEDEPRATKLLVEHISQFSFLELIATFSDGKAAVDFISSNDVDLLFLDINIPNVSGIELAKLVNPDAKIIFTTAYPDYAVESYEFNTIDYLVKPITFSRFSKAIIKAKQVFNESKINPTYEGYVFAKVGRKFVKINYDTILFIEGAKEYAYVITEADKYIVYKRMKDIAETFPASFITVHHSFIVNLLFITKVEQETVYLGDHRIPISEKYKKEFFELLKNKLI